MINSDMVTDRDQAVCTVSAVYAYSRAKAAERLGISSKELGRAVEAGQALPPTLVTPGGRQYWDADDLEELVATCTWSPAPKYAGRNHSPWRRVGDHQVCKRGHVIAGDADWVVTNQGRRRLCRKCHAQRNALSRRNVTARKPRVVRSCLGCGVPTGHPKFCSRSCGSLESNRIRADRERAENFGVEFEPLHRVQVYERDGWVCQLCTLPVPWFLRWPHDWSGVLDHRMPLSLGGDHVASNVQLAHRVCNAWKKAMGPAEFAQRLVEIGLGRWELARA